ncbi:MAG: filamentous hemagglutinin N-terminal domain-containing protein, partial [Roseimicrobium sp.]
MPHPEAPTTSGAHRPASRVALRAALTICLASGLALPLWAGDILRNGAKPKASRATASEQATSAATAQARANAKDALSRTTQALNAVKAMQAAARSAALGGANNLGPDPNHPGFQLPNVPDGLTPGGLQVLVGGVWTGANGPVQSGSQVTVTQTDQQALLDWQTFNIGRNTRLHFDQTAGGEEIGKWIAFNRVRDPTGSPSQILGSITAGGQVYVINQNGIIFGGSSQVNTHVLVASSLPINENLINRGLLNNPDAQFLFSAFPQPAGSDGPTDAFTPPVALTPTGLSGDVTVQAGAELTAPTTSANVGGRVVLVGPNVTNNGIISTPDGQTILAAGLQVGFEAHKSSDPSLRGLDVYVGAVNRYRLTGKFNAGGTTVTVFSTNGLKVGASVSGEGIAPGTTIQSITDATHYVLSIPAIATPVAAAGAGLDISISQPNGTVTHTGYIDAPRGNISLAGKVVNQLAAIRSSTSVSLNGRIDLLASYDAISNTTYDPVGRPDLAPFLNRSTGLVRIGTGSVMEILPEYSSADKAIGTQLALRSKATIVGKAINFESDSLFLAPNGQVSVSAGVWDFTLTGTNATNPFVYSGGQIYLSQGSLINVAGSTDVAVPLSQHILSVELRGAEVADSPLQRNSIFRRPNATNPTITVDLRKTGTYNGIKWVGTPLANLTGYLNIIERSVGQLTVAGGSVDLNAGGSVVIENGATVDVSGGFVNYEGGTVATTRVMHQGRLFEIADAVPDLIYEGIFTGLFKESHARWGITRTYKVPWMTGEHYEQPYVHGADGGSLAIGASSMALDGDLQGHTIAGPRQREEPPALSELSLSFQSQVVQVGPPLNPFVSPNPPTVAFADDATQSPVGGFALDANGDPLPLPADRVA